MLIVCSCWSLQSSPNQETTMQRKTMCLGSYLSQLYKRFHLNENKRHFPLEQFTQK